MLHTWSKVLHASRCASPDHVRLSTIWALYMVRHMSQRNVLVALSICLCQSTPVYASLRQHGAWKWIHAIQIQTDQSCLLFAPCSGWTRNRDGSSTVVNRIRTTLEKMNRVFPRFALLVCCSDATRPSSLVNDNKSASFSIRHAMKRVTQMPKRPETGNFETRRAQELHVPLTQEGDAIATFRSQISVSSTGIFTTRSSKECKAT